MNDWKAIPGFEGLYEINPQGLVRNLFPSKKTPANHVLKPIKAGNGYKIVRLYKGKRPFSRYIHRLVMEAFVGPCPKRSNVNHKNGIKDDNRLENLEYLTFSANSLHAYANGLMPKQDLRGSRNSNASITESTALTIDEMLKTGKRAMDIARELNISHWIVYDIKQRRKWKHLFEAA